MIEIFTAPRWQMTFGERAAIEGILTQLQPRLAIEIGTAQGGSLDRIANHSEEVHCFDLVEPPAEGVPDNVTPHIGDSHELLPKVLAKLAAEGKTLDFVLVDGDHTADGVERDVRDLLGSDAVRNTLILLHDTLNDDVRAGLQRVDYAAEPRVAYVDLDFIGGHLSLGGPFHHELWGGLGLIVVDGEDGAPPSQTGDEGRFYDLFQLIAPARDALVASGARVGPARRAVRAAKRRLRSS